MKLENPLQVLPFLFYAVLQVPTSGTPYGSAIGGDIVNKFQTLEMPGFRYRVIFLDTPARYTSSTTNLAWCRMP
jgi:hypothetical protein